MMDVSNATFLMRGFEQIQSGEKPWVAGFKADPSQKEGTRWAGQPIMDKMPDCIQDEHNNFVCVSTFIIGVDGLYHRRQGQFARMHLVMVDDIGTKVNQSKIKLPFSALVETSPNNCQGWYFLSPPEDDPARATYLVDQMVAKGLTADGKDPGMKNLTRYGRLPQGVNSKAKYVEVLGHPFVQRVHEWNPDFRYSVAEIAEAYDIDLNQISAKKAMSSKFNQSVSISTVNTQSLLPDIIRCGMYLETIDQNKGIHRIRCPWIMEHTDQDETGTAYFEPSPDNNGFGGFKCHHGHCMNRDIKHLSTFIREVNRLTKENSNA